MVAKIKTITASITMLSTLMFGGCQAISQQPIMGIDVDKSGNGVSKTNIAANIDSDNDGVIDDFDLCPNTPENMIIDERGCPRKAIPRNDEVLMDYLAFFDSNSSELSKSYQTELDMRAKKLSQYSNVIITINGSVTNDEWALENSTPANATKDNSTTPELSNLARARADAVKQYLINNYDIHVDHIRTFDCGNRTPLVEDTEEGNAYNRRVFARMTNIGMDANESGSKPCVEF